MISFLSLYCFHTFLCEGLYSFPESCKIKEFLRIFPGKGSANASFFCVERRDRGRGNPFKELRGKIGEKILISDGEGVDYQCEIQSFSEDEASLSICFREEPHELPAKRILIQALPKGDKMEWIIQKAVELGISALIPLESKNTVMKLKEKKEEKKISRWQSIMDAAAKQSKRSILPKMENGMGWKEAFSYVKDCDFKLLPYENERGVVPTREILSKMEEAVKGKKDCSIALCIGPEGGFTKEEVEAAMAEGFLPISLGKRILRTETAAITALSLIMMQLEYAITE